MAWNCPDEVVGGTIHLNHLAFKSSRNIRYRFFSDNENVLSRVSALAEADSCNVEGGKGLQWGEGEGEKEAEEALTDGMGEAAQQLLGDPSHQSPRQLRQPQEATEGKAQNRSRAACGTLTMEAYNPMAAEPMGLSTVPLPCNNKSHKERNWSYLIFGGFQARCHYPGDCYNLFLKLFPRLFKLNLSEGCLAGSVGRVHNP